METRNYICAGNTYTYAKGYIGLPIEVSTIPEIISINSEQLVRKLTFHVSLLCVKDIIEKLGDIESRVLDFFCSYSAAYPITFEGYTGEFRFAQDGERKTFIALCRVSNLAGFSKALSKEIGIEIFDQPTHVTLYTLQSEVGIGLNSQKDMQAKSTSVEVPEEVRLGILGSNIEQNV